MFKKKKVLERKKKRTEPVEYKTHLKFVFPNVNLIKSILMFRPIIRTTPGQIATHTMTIEYKHLKAHYSILLNLWSTIRMDLCWYKSQFYEFNTVTHKRKHKQAMWKTPGHQ